ncbi:MAG: 3-hydroxyisobutyrate dehydrogenase [Pseudomonadota bacterium]
MKIGFIGLGNMGAPMARNLAAAGHDVTGHDLQPVEIEGVAPAANLAAVARERDVIFTMLPNGAAVREVHAAVIEHAKRGACLIDCSTIDVQSARDSAEAAEAAGFHALDAPVSGGTGGAQAGTLTFMVGGPDAAFEIGQPLFDVMGARAIHCGGAGSGQIAKTCNNMILGATMVAVCESFALGSKLGLDPKALFNVVSTSSAQCWSINTYCPVPDIGPKTPADAGYAPGFAAELMLKDMRLSQEAAHMAGAQTDLSDHATEIYRSFVETGGEGLDFSGLYLRIRDTSRG